MRILVVDDDAISLHMVQRALNREGHEAVAVHDGEHAWELIQENTFDAFVIDWRLPGIDGLELTRRIRTLRGRGPIVVVVSVLDSREEKAEALSAGADRHVGKPFCADEILEALQSVTDRLRDDD